VPKDVFWFDNTLRYNILFGADESATEKELQQAIKMARVDEFLKNMENGLDTLIGERGVKLSGGERQRVGIARALVKNPAILIFDEATSSLDVENEAIIRESIEKASKGRTTIIIAHRLSTIKDADKIIVLEKGRIIGEGKHKDLLKNCEAYNKMIKIQTVIVG
jgi:ABC-type multidrug transport system fused ATPase/permease subunit